MNAGKKMILDYIRLNMGHRLSAVESRRLRLLDPVIDAVAGGGQVLAGESEVDEDAVAAGLTRLVGIECIDVTTVLVPMASVRVLPRKLDDYCVLTADVLEVELMTVVRRLGSAETGRLIDFMRIAFVPGVNDLSRGRLRPVFEHLEEGLVQRGLFALYHLAPAVLVGHMLTGNEEGIRRVAPLLRHMVQVLPLGSVHDEPFAWAVICG